MKLAVVASEANHNLNTSRDKLHDSIEALPVNLLEQYKQVRKRSRQLVASLKDEDRVVQSMPDASPAKWHLAHTTWFFETFLLVPQLNGYEVFDPAFAYLFNSYYEALGPRHPRPHRGLLTRPTSQLVDAYREYVDAHMNKLLRSTTPADLGSLVRLGIAHEEQHQELILMDILHLFAQSPLKPAYQLDWPLDKSGPAGSFRLQGGGLIEIGDADAVFTFDNERPRHKVWLEPYEISDRLVTNREWLAFMEDGGYTRPTIWLSDGWTHV